MLPENWDTVIAFLQVQTQWRMSASGHKTGLDYASCAAALGQRLFKRVFSGLRVMEYETLNILYNELENR